MEKAKLYTLDNEIVHLLTENGRYHQKRNIYPHEIQKQLDTPARRSG